MFKLEKIKQLEKEYGLPLYVFHQKEFEENYLNLLKIFQKIYPKYNIAYSYKTNYTPKICSIVKKLGGLAEVVSDMEYRLAKKLGYENKNIIFNGPIKGKALFEHLLNGGVINVDSINELEKIISFAQKNFNKIFKIAFRVNIDIGQGFTSRFGLDAYEDERSKDSELEKAFLLVNKCSNIRIVGLHCHIGRARNIEAWENRIRIMFKLIDMYFKEVPEFIDLGSGMNSIMEESLAEQFPGPIPTYDEYAFVVAKAMKIKFGDLDYDKQPILYTEPGTTIISKYISFIAKVENIKNVKNKTYVTFNCSSGNMGDICRLKKLPISIYHVGEQSTKCENATFVGYTCLEHDHIYEGYDGEISVGDFVEFRNIGSYSNVFKPPFILPNCAMISENKDGSVELIKKAETFDYIFETYVF